MMNTDLTEIQIPQKNLILKLVTNEDKWFINNMINDPDVRKNIVLPNNLKSDPGRLIEYWLNNIKQNVGRVWTISAKGALLNGGDYSGGYFAIEEKESPTNVRISFALVPSFRKRGFMTIIIDTVVLKLIEMGVVTVEAVVEMENVGAQKFMSKMGFKTFRRNSFIDDDVANTFRVLYEKPLFDLTKKGYLLDEEGTERLLNSSLKFNAYPETEFNINDLALKPTGRYKFIFSAEITESLVGISSNNTRKYTVTWELTELLKTGSISVMIFLGRDDVYENNSQFENHRICIENDIILYIIRDLMQQNPKKFSREIMSKVVGLESVEL